MPQGESNQHIPRSFYCPLTMEVMYDPVIDAEGNTYERKALLKWLLRYGISPLSRQPLNSNLLAPNHALRDTIHEVMGASWVSQRKEELDRHYLEAEKLGCSHSSKYRARMDAFLRSLSRDVGGGMELDLDANGVCMFNCQGMTIIIEVPKDLGFFSVFTIMHVPFLSEETKDTMLELNRIPSETSKSMNPRPPSSAFPRPLKNCFLTLPPHFHIKGGGCLSVKRYEHGSYDVFFSYSDRIDEISTADFCNIIPNFIECASKLKTRFYGSHEDAPTPSAPISHQGGPCVGGMVAKLL